MHLFIHTTYIYTHTHGPFDEPLRRHIHIDIMYFHTQLRIYTYVYSCYIYT